MKDEIVMAILREMTPLLGQEQLDALKVDCQGCTQRIRSPEAGNVPHADRSEWHELSAGISGELPSKWKV